MKTPDGDDRIGRREWLQRGALAGLGLSALPLRAWAQPGGQVRVRRYATLGRTGLRVSDVSFGGSRLGAQEEDIVRHAFDQGRGTSCQSASTRVLAETGGIDATTAAGCIGGDQCARRQTGFGPGADACT